HEAVTKEKRSKAFKGIFWYGLARLVLFLAIFALMIVVLYLFGVYMPAALTAVFALIIALPVSVLMFPNLRMSANESVAQWSDARRAHKEYLREQLAEREN